MSDDNDDFKGIREPLSGCGFAVLVLFLLLALLLGTCLLMTN